MRNSLQPLKLLNIYFTANILASVGYSAFCGVVREEITQNKKIGRKNFRQNIIHVFTLTQKEAFGLLLFKNQNLSIKTYFKSLSPANAELSLGRRISA